MEKKNKHVQDDEAFIDATCAMGESFGLDEAAAQLMAGAQALFGNGEDGRAELLRSWSRKFKSAADARYVHPDVFAVPPRLDGRRGTQRGA